MKREEVRSQKSEARRLTDIRYPSAFGLLNAGFLLVLAFPSSLLAHAKSTSYSTWEITGNRAQVTVRVPVIEFQRLGFASPRASSDVHSREGDAKRDYVTYLTNHIQLFAGAQPCEPLPASSRSVPSSNSTRLTQTWELLCPSSQGLQLRMDAFFVAAPAHLHFARVRLQGGSGIEKIFSVHDREWQISGLTAVAEKTSHRFFDYLWFGVTHILSGVDHLVFLLALLLITESMPAVVQVITGFTVAHSVTLTLGVLNMVRPPPLTIEALIGFSIAMVALENFVRTTGKATQRWLAGALTTALLICLAAAGFGVLQVPFLAFLGLSIFSIAYMYLLCEQAEQHSLRWFVAFVFGLIHGFGFAGGLTDLALPAGRTAVALFGFNCGVELGQLGVVALLYPCLTYLRPSVGMQIQRMTIQAGSAGILALGIFWFVTRAVGR